MYQNGDRIATGAGSQMTLYDEIGGDAAITKVVDEYWHGVTADAVLSPWFARADPPTIREHLRAYLAVALGGPEAYEGRSMRHAHSGLRITGDAFDLLLERMADALAAVGASDASIDKVAARLRSLRAVVVEPCPGG
jgi:hemoglobin